MTALQDARFTTSELLELERGLLAIASARATEQAPHVTAEDVRPAFEARPSMSAEQHELVARVVRAAGGVQVVLAPAGTGKTFALDAAREAWQRAGVPVLGCALSARAACELRDQAAIETTTIARLRMALEAGCELKAGSVLIVDEAGMVGTRDLAALAAAAAAAQARLVLVGDDRQLSEIDAGGAFSALATQLGAIELHDVRRQAEAWDRDALAQLRSGDVEVFARAYADRGRIVAMPNAAAAREALVGDWWQATARGEDTLMLAHRRADVADLNIRARTLMRAAGRLAADELLCGPRAFAVGDQVLATLNDRRLAVHNGQAGRIAAITDDDLHLVLPDGHGLVLPVAYACAGHLDHAYALTAHRAQGATVDSAFVLGSDELYREWGYTALSRHRHEAHFYVSATPDFLNTPTPPLSEPHDTSSAVARALTASRRQQLASAAERVDPSLARAEVARSAADEAAHQLESLETQFRSTPLLRRRQRAELCHAIEEATRRSDRQRAGLERLERDLEVNPAASLPTVARARDPLPRLDAPTPERAVTAPTRDQQHHDLRLDL